MLVHDDYPKPVVEHVLFAHHWIVLEESDTQTLYVSNMEPGGEFVIDWSRGVVNKDDLQVILEGEITDWHTIMKDL